MKNIARIVLGIVAAFLLMLISLSLGSCSAQYKCTTVYVSFHDIEGTSDTMRTPTIFIERGSVLINRTDNRRHREYKVTESEVQVTSKEGIFHYQK